MSAAELAARRTRIDRIDAVLVRLVAARQRQVALIAGLKAGPESVRDPQRVAAILARVRSAAGRCGLDEALAVAVWRELLERSAEAQQALLRRSDPIGRLDDGQAAGAGPSSLSPPRSSMPDGTVVQESS
ncbi:chorismate mutase [Brevundimonas sp.]|uniref:chorismate mutase n=1 Tax=Brevundimonas sp. TaxID=1871086 RepID=UPI002BA99306|nr:chorismate mutase [Brevundimonas sp.]HWQ87637.1 chorismate mutase [Brevundimonas sp.]